MIPFFDHFLKYEITLYSFSAIVPTAGTSGVDESTSTKSPAKIKGRDVWQQLGISDSQLLEYNEKFRLWLSSTVLQPLVAEINRINESLTAHGLADARIGNYIIGHFHMHTCSLSFSLFIRGIELGKVAQNLSTGSCCG